jgi:hypothetical protein
MSREYRIEMIWPAAALVDKADLPHHEKGGRDRRSATKPIPGA